MKKEAYKNNLHKVNKHNEKQVVQIDTSTNQIIKTFKSINQIKKEFGYCTSNILRCCKKIKNHNTAYGYKWEYANRLNKD